MTTDQHWQRDVERVHSENRRLQAGRDLDRSAMKLALAALVDSRDDVNECLGQMLPCAGWERYDRRIEAYQQQLIKHDAAIEELRTRLLT